VIQIRHGSGHHLSVFAVTMQILCACNLKTSIAAQHVFTKVEFQGPHAPAPAVAVSDARQAAAAFGAMHVDQDEEVEDETMLHEFFRTKRVFRGSRG